MALLQRSAATTANPQQAEQATKLVTGGVFRISRNPMYLSLGFILLAWAVDLSSLGSLAGVVLFMAYIQACRLCPKNRRWRPGGTARDRCADGHERPWPVSAVPMMNHQTLSAPGEPFGG